MWAAIGYGICGLVCWRKVALFLVAEAETFAPPDENWLTALFVGLLAALIWPLILLFYRPPSGR